MLVSYDVLEHIYSLDDFFKTACEFMPDNKYIIMGSGANSFNDKIVKKYEQMHYETDFKDRNFEYGHKMRDSLESYFGIRKKIISEYLKLNNKEYNEFMINDLALLTKGMIKHDIESFVENFINGKVQTKKVTRFISNTCDPMTGNWNEHLIDFNLLKDKVLKNSNVQNVALYPRKNIKDSDVISFIVY